MKRASTPRALGALVASATALAAIAAAPVPAQAGVACNAYGDQPRCGYKISYTSGMGVAHRNGPWDSARDGQPGIAENTPVKIWCYGWGDPVGSNGNRLWWNLETYDERSSWVSDHWLNTPVPTNPPFVNHPCQ